MKFDIIAEGWQRRKAQIAETGQMKCWHTGCQQTRSANPTEYLQLWECPEHRKEREEREARRNK